MADVLHNLHSTEMWNQRHFSLGIVKELKASVQNSQRALNNFLVKKSDQYPFESTQRSVEYAKDGCLAHAA